MDDETLAKVRELIKQAESRLNEAKEDALKARKAGIDVTTHERRISGLNAKLRQLKAVYS